MTLETALAEMLVLRLEATLETAQGNAGSNAGDNACEFGLVWHNRIDVEITLTYVG